MGIERERVEHLLWRLEHDEFKGWRDIVQSKSKEEENEFDLHRDQATSSLCMKYKFPCAIVLHIGQENIRFGHTPTEGTYSLPSLYIIFF